MEKREARGQRQGIRWLRALVLALWLGAILFCVQFALASAAELEPQAALMGWMLAAIVAGSGLAVAGTYLYHPHSDD